MKLLTPRRDAADAVAASANRPATAIVHDSPDVRLVVFRIAPGQSVSPHRSTSSVMLTVLAGGGVVSGESSEQVVQVGDTICYAPNELHGMRAPDTELHLLATITPRPGNRPTP